MTDCKLVGFSMVISRCEWSVDEPGTAAGRHTHASYTVKWSEYMTPDTSVRMTNATASPPAARDSSVVMPMLRVAHFLKGPTKGICKRH